MTIQLIHGDALTVLRDLPGNHADALITDPPYSSGGAFRGDRTARPLTKYVRTESQAVLTAPEFTGDSRDQRAFVVWCDLWMRECLRVVKPGGLACVFTDWRQLPAVSDAFQVAGWTWRGIVVWHKKGAGMGLRGRFRHGCEFVVWGSKGPMPEDATMPCLDNLAACVPLAGAAKRHITEKPVPVIAHLLRLVPPGGLVLDPFAGSATTGVAALQSGHRFLGIELDEACYRAALDRLQQDIPLFSGAAG